MWFWIRHISAALILIALGVYIAVAEKPFLSQETNLGSNQNKSNNNASGTKTAEGFTNFYASLKSKIDSLTSPDQEQYVIELKRPDTSLTAELMRIGPSVKPVSGHWVGPFRNRRFVEGDTLRERMIDIANEEHMSLIWWLERDFVVKLPFRVEETAVGTLYKMTTAIDADFEKDVFSFFCPIQRALVITDAVDHYVRENCTPTRSSDSKRWRLFK
ncbi:toxin co-regulated pilus biosynthesis Q family protein [Catenovulum sp. 2E275]|uniref:toxin co-regulated pilus biosynthesis Q family protein n=1 Tax=Catenovulum sp. 2E275 TaxID=2980497 RepID=UPI0021D02E10|nr:toxin co-regulated pilus biosynthesis Q family protein [Catenovulum sp. 2E275]MCU4676896.1 toxin co-regulated pilus biosynthesis Q family protein [Catenovulum sp. 2E275]